MNGTLLVVFIVAICVGLLFNERRVVRNRERALKDIMRRRYGNGVK